MRSTYTRNLLIAGIYAAIFIGTISTSAWAQQVPQVPPMPPMPPMPAVPSHASHVIINSHGGSHGFLGVGLSPMTPELRAHFGAPKDAGILVSMVEPKSPAAKAKVKVGDIIIKAGKTKINCAGELQNVVRAKKKGQTLKLKILRGKKTIPIAVKVEERKRTKIDIGKHIIVNSPIGEHNIDIHLNLDDMEEALEGFDEIDIPDLEGLIDLEKMGADIEKALNDPKIKKKLKELKKMEEKEKALKERMEELEKRMKELNKKLQSKLKKIQAKKLASAA